MLEKLVERGKTMAVLFYDPNDDEDHLIMDELEKIDDDCRRYLLTCTNFSRYIGKGRSLPRCN